MPAGEVRRWVGLTGLYLVITRTRTTPSYRPPGDTFWLMRPGQQDPNLLISRKPTGNTDWLTSTLFIILHLRHHSAGWESFWCRSYKLGLSWLPPAPNLWIFSRQRCDSGVTRGETVSSLAACWSLSFNCRMSILSRSLYMVKPWHIVHHLQVLMTTSLEGILPLQVQTNINLLKSLRSYHESWGINFVKKISKSLEVAIIREI